MPLTLGLGFKLFGIDRLSGVLKKVGRGFANMTREVRTATKTMADGFRASKISSGSLLVAGAAAAGFGALITKAALSAGDFQQQMGFLGVVTGASRETLEDLETEILSLSTQFGVVPIKVAKTALALSRLGFRANEVKKLLVPTLGLIVASMGKLGPDQAGKLLGQTLKSFGLKAKDATLIGNQLSTIVARTAIDFDKMGLAIGTAGGFVAQFGGTTAEMLTFLGLAADVIARTERGATAMRNVFSDLADTQRQLKIQTMLGIEVVDRQTGKFKNIVNILEVLFEKFGELRQAERLAAIQSIFSKEAAGGLAAMMKRLETGITDATGKTLFGADALRLLVGEVGEGVVTLEEFVEKALGPLPGLMGISGASIAKFAIIMGKSFGIVLGPIVKGVSLLFEGFTFVIQKMGFFGKGLGIVIGVLGVLIGLLAPPLLTAAIFMKIFGGGSIFAAFATKGFTAALWSLFGAAIAVLGIFALLGLAVGLIGSAFGAFDADEVVAKQVASANAAIGGIQAPGAPGAAGRGGAQRTTTTAGLEAFGDDPGGAAAVESFDRLPSPPPGGFARARPPEDRQIVVNFVVDGRKIARAVARVNERDRQRTFGTKVKT